MGNLVLGRLVHLGESTKGQRGQERPRFCNVRLALEFEDSIPAYAVSVNILTVLFVGTRKGWGGRGVLPKSGGPRGGTMLP
jgi:hypothetical protein